MPRRMVKTIRTSSKQRLVTALRKKRFYLPIYSLAAFSVIFLLVLPFIPQVQSTGQVIVAKNPQVKSFVPKTFQPLDYTLPTTGNWLIIPKANVKMPIVEGQTLDVLNKHVGVWHQTGDADDNFVLAGHRLQYGRSVNESLYNLDKLEPGDHAVFVVLNGQPTEYKVTVAKVVPPTSVEILEPTGRKQLTIYTCQDFFNQRRFVIIAEPV